jgi:tetratricopeptide (TPR) repeat protein
VSARNAARALGLLLSLVVAGCGTHRQPVAAGPAFPAAAVQPSANGAPAAKQPTSSSARPATIETTDQRLSEALRTATLLPGPETYRALASEYWRLKIFDAAHTYLVAAQRLAPNDPATSDALARLWRDAGFPQLGLADAQRAVKLAPESPIAFNTLGTLYQALGQRQEAIAMYERARTLEPTAVYALNNLCYARLLERQPELAAGLCRQALAIDPTMAAARNNLALAQAATGRTDAARETFEAAGNRAEAQYNLGIVHMAQKNYRSAVDAFAQAHRLQPTMDAALARARQASGLAARAEE